MRTMVLAVIAALVTLPAVADEPTIALKPGPGTR